VSQDETFVCAAPAASVYAVSLVRVVVTGDRNVYVNAGAFGSLTFGRFDAPGEGKETLFDKALGNVTAASLVGARVRVEVKHDKLGPDEPLGRCSYRVAAKDVAANKVVIARTSGCDGSVTGVEFALTRVR